jgi:hypothetical protein
LSRPDFLFSLHTRPLAMRFNSISALAAVLSLAASGVLSSVIPKTRGVESNAGTFAEEATLCIKEFCATKGSEKQTTTQCGPVVLTVAHLGALSSVEECVSQFTYLIAQDTEGSASQTKEALYEISAEDNNEPAAKEKRAKPKSAKSTQAKTPAANPTPSKASSSKAASSQAAPLEASSSKGAPSQAAPSKASSSKASSSKAASTGKPSLGTAKGSSTEKASSATGKASVIEKASSKPGKVSPTPTPKPTPLPAPACNLPQKDQKPAGQTKTGAARRFISKLLGRASTGGQPDTAPAAACGVGQGGGAIQVMKLQGWGETWFGIQWFPDQKMTITNEELFWSAKDAYNNIMARSSPSSVVLVAALFVPGRGIYFGTIPRDAGVDKFKTECEAQAKHLWQVIGGKKIIDTNKSQTLWHAEDAAMFWATRQAQIQGSFPGNAKLLNYGRINNNGQAVQIPSCDTQTAKDKLNRLANFPGNTGPDCAGNVLEMNVGLAGTVPRNEQQRPAA